MPKCMYVCEVCERVFSTEKGASDCESKHNVAVSIQAQVYDDNSKPGKYPDVLKMKMSNGQVVQYFRRLK